VYIQSITSRSTGEYGGDTMENHSLAQIDETAPLACSLTDDELAARGATVDDLFAAALEVEELADGYALKIPSASPWPERALAFVQEERSCCQFFTFELIFSPNLGPIWLSIRGPEGVKLIVGEWLARRNVDTP
jgi:hypothetical protein